MNNIKKIIALLSAFILIFLSVIPVFAEEKTYKQGDIIEFGSYPQSQVTDKSVINKLNKKQLQWNKYSDNIFDEKTEETIYTVIYSYCDTELNSEKYRAIKYSPTVIKNHPELSSDTIWFKYEPVEWVIIDPETGYVLCNDILDIRYFRYFENWEGLFDSSASQWETSDIRTWLNDEFYDVTFSDNEKNSIYDTKTNTTTDKIVLFSLEDVLNSDFGFNTFKEEGFYYYYANETLHRDYTQYSSALDVRSLATNRWLLRKTTGSFIRPAVVYKKAPADFGLGDTGKNEAFTELLCKIDYFDYVNAATASGVVPAMHINLETFNKTIQYGDIDNNGKLSAADARLTLRAAVGLETFSDELIKIADVNKNGRIESADARLILRAAVGLEDPSTW